MDQEGIAVAVVYPTRGLFAQGIDGMEPKLAAAIARAYNNWLYDFCAANPQRLIGAGMISPFEIDDAVAEAQRAVKELGFKGIFLRPNPVNGRNWHDPYYEPLWSELEALDVPLGFHEGLGAHLPQVGERYGRNVMLRHTVCHPGEQMLAAVSFCGGGILARHPRLRVAFLEGNASWVPFLLWRMDEHYEWLGDVFARDLSMEPSAYFKRQCFVSVECDEEPVKALLDLDRLRGQGRGRHDAPFARALGAQWIGRRRRLEVAKLERARRVGGRGERVVHQRRGEPLAGLVVRELNVQRIGDALDNPAVD